ncbi:MAG: ATP-binding protein [Desulfovibrionaceae bacterium]
MLNVSEREILERMASDNPWWELGAGGVSEFYTSLGRRDYYAGFYRLLAESEVRRAVVLMGPRRVGKTVILFQSVDALLASGVDPKSILFLSVDMPLYQGIALDRLVTLFMRHNGLTRDDRMFLLFDEIQYLPDWERHLKVLVDTYLRSRIAVSGSAAAALRRKSSESGAGRFTDYLLPPLTFAEYLALIGREEELIVWRKPGRSVGAEAVDISELNREFVNYLNYGGYPEAVADPEVRKDPTRFIKRDIVDKVLLRDLPSLYGIQDVQELNRLLNTLAYNTGNILSLEKLAKSSGVSKDTLKRYIEYLEAAFLIKKVRRVDENGKRFQRERSFKVYLTNPSMRAALFNPVKEDDQAMGLLAETALFSQWFHSPEELFYANWKQGEVDMVVLDAAGGVKWCTEVKWTDRYYAHPEELHPLLQFVKHANVPESPIVTTKTAHGWRELDGVSIYFLPTSLSCYLSGKGSVTMKMGSTHD